VDENFAGTKIIDTARIREGGGVAWEMLLAKTRGFKKNDL
jgi:hypothetical protein